MIGIRDLGFFGVVVLGAAGLGMNVLPSRHSARPGQSSARRAEDRGLPVIGEVDREFRRRWAEERVEPASTAPDLAVLRRMSLALTGSIPSLEEIRRFEAIPGPERRAAWLEEILWDRRFSDYFAERLARAFVGTEDGPFLLYRRRRFVNWLSDQLLANRPYDQVVRDMIAGQGLWTDHPATNFVSVTIDPEKQEPDPERLAARSARAFLGVRIDCAQCHDHPFQPWKQQDFQGVAAFYGQVHHGLTGIHDAAGRFEVTDRKTGKPVTIEPRVPFLTELWTRKGTRREQLARWVTHPKNPNLARATVNRVWALLFGKPLVEPVDDLPADGDLPEVLTTLADDFRDHGYDLKRLIRALAATEAFRLASATRGDVSEAQERSWAVFPLTRLRPEQVVGGVFQSASIETIDRDSHILVRIARAAGESEFVHRYGDTGEDEFTDGSGTIPQRLLLMNGELVGEKTKPDLFNAATRIAVFAPDDRAAVEALYLVALTRRPTAEEAGHFIAKLAGSSGDERKQRLADASWTLLNSTEFSWNH